MFHGMEWRWEIIIDAGESWKGDRGLVILIARGERERGGGEEGRRPERRQGSCSSSNREKMDVMHVCFSLLVRNRALCIRSN